MSSTQSPLRFIPYAAITAVGMLATDLTLPAMRGAMMIASVIAVSLLPPSLADGDAPHARTRAPEEGE